MMRRTKLLLVGPIPDAAGKWITGAQQAFKLLVDGLSGGAAKVHVVRSNPDFVKKEFGVFSIGKVFAAMGVLWKFLGRVVFTDRVYLLLSSSWYGFLRSAIYIWISVLLDREVIIHLHGGGFGDFYKSLGTLPRWFVRLTINRIWRIIVLSEGLREQFSFVQYASCIAVVPNGTPEVATKVECHPKQLDVPLHILYLSNLIKEKGYLDVLEACRLLKKDHGVAIICHFAGNFAVVTASDEGKAGLTPGKLESQFQARIEEYGLEGNVTYHGVVDGAEKRKLLMDSHIFCLPTYYPWEGQPISIIEALSTGTPVVTTEFRGNTDLIIDHHNGIFVPPRSPEAIVDAIIEVCKTSDIYKAYSQHAYSYYRKNFTVHKYIARLADVLLETDLSG